MKISLIVRRAKCLKRSLKTFWRIVNSGLPCTLIFITSSIILSQSPLLSNALAKSTNHFLALSPENKIQSPNNEVLLKQNHSRIEMTVALLTFINDENKEINNCTGTYINYKNNCYLLTNEHCFSKYTKAVNVVDYNNQKSTKSAHKFFLDRSKDLAVIYLQTTTTDNLSDAHKSSCNVAPSFSETDIQKIELENEEIPWGNSPNNKDDSYFVNLISLGYTNKILQFLQSENYSFGYGHIERIKTSLNINYLIRASKLLMHKGMSGGPVLKGNKLLGIKTTFIPEQYVTHIIPVNEILKFIDDHVELSRSLITQSNSVITPHNSFSFGGENSGIFGGENSGTHGGENSASNGTAIQDLHLKLNEKNRPSDVQSLEDIISYLQEPEEGIIFNPQKRERLLAVCTSNPCTGNPKKMIQIDGRDEWDEIKKSYPDNKLSLIYENSNYFFENKDKIIDRVIPNFASGEPTRSGVSFITLKANDNGTVSTHRILLGNPVITLEKESYEQESPIPFISLFTSSSKRISVKLSVSNFNLLTSLFREVSFPNKDFKFHLELNEERDIISVKETDGTVYECKNSYFYKIICFSKGKILSFSRSKIYKDTLYLRFAEILRSNSELKRLTDGVIYYYSTLEIKND